MIIKHIKMDSGERLPMLIIDNAIPDFWATLYVCNLLSSRAQNTIEHALNVLRHLRAYGRLVCIYARLFQVPVSVYAK